MKLISLILLIAILNALDCGAQEVDFSHICPKPNEYYNVIKFDQIKQVIEAAKVDAKECESQKQSILDVERVISDENLRDICGQNLYQDIKDYHLKYISVYTPEASKDEIKQRMKSEKAPIPMSISEFFLTFSSSVTLQCTRNAMRRFVHELKSVQIDKDELHLMSKAREEAAVYLNLDPKSSLNSIKLYFDEIILLPHPAEKQLDVAVENVGTTLFKVKNSCRLRYEPAYEKIFAPFIRLNNLGYGVDLLYDDEEAMLNGKEFEAWRHVIGTCELLKGLNVLVDETLTKNKLISKEEAELLRGKQPELEGDAKLVLDIPHKPLEMNTAMDVCTVRVRFQDAVERYMHEKLKHNPVAAVRKLVKNIRGFCKV